MKGRRRTRDLFEPRRETIEDITLSHQRAALLVPSLLNASGQCFSFECLRRTDHPGERVHEARRRDVSGVRHLGDSVLDHFLEGLADALGGRR